MRSLGGDRRASLMEIEKLALYASGQGSVTLDDVEAVVSDVAASVLNTLVDAAFDGRIEVVERDSRRFRLEGLDPAQVLGSALRHATAMLALRLDNPEKSSSAMAAAWRGLHFKRKASVERQLGLWGPARLRQAIDILAQAVLASRRAEPALAEAIASAALLRIAEAPPPLRLRIARSRPPPLRRVSRPPGPSAGRAGSATRRGWRSAGGSRPSPRPSACR